MFIFLVVKYISLALTSCRALLLAALLGPASYGVLGTLVLVQQYLSYAALGVREGLTVKLAHSHGDDALTLRLCSSALFWGICVGGLILLGALVLAASHGGHADWLWVGIISCLSVTNEILININRDQNRILKVALLEVTFNAVPLVTALILGKAITVKIALMAMAIGLAMSVAGYAAGPRYFRWREIRRDAIAELVKIGIPLAFLSLATNSLTGIFVFAAGAMTPGRTVGLLVFANSLCMIILFGLNMTAWAATSQSMKVLQASAWDEGGDARGVRLTSFFRLGLVLAAGSLLCVGEVFEFVMTSYRGSEVFAVYLCLLQSYGLLLYRELNYLAVKGKSIVIAAGYAAILAVIVALSVLAPRLGLIHLMLGSIGLLCVSSYCCVAYCRRLGFRDRGFRAQCGFLLFPPLFGGAFAATGAPGAALVMVGFVIGWVILYKDAALSWRRARRAG